MTRTCTSHCDSYIAAVFIAADTVSRLMLWTQPTCIHELLRRHESCIHTLFACLPLWGDEESDNIPEGFRVRIFPQHLLVFPQ